MKASEIYPATASGHLGAGDIGTGNEWRVSLHAFDTFDFGDSGGVKLTCEIRTLAGKSHDKRLAINKTNARYLQGVFGDDVSGWDSERVVLFVNATPMGPGIGVRVEAPPSAAAQAAEPAFEAPAQAQPRSAQEAVDAAF